MKCLEIARLQDFALNTPGLLGALSEREREREGEKERERLFNPIMGGLFNSQCVQITTSEREFIYTKNKVRFLQRQLLFR